MPTGTLLPVPLLIATVTDIARVTRVPLTVDVEGGYSNDPAAVGGVVGQVIEAGGVGINIEDGTGAPDLLCAKIEEAKRAGVRLGADLFVNARTDVYLSALAPPEEAGRGDAGAHRALPGGRSRRDLRARGDGPRQRSRPSPRPPSFP